MQAHPPAAQSGVIHGAFDKLMPTETHCCHRIGREAAACGDFFLAPQFYRSRQ